MLSLWISIKNLFPCLRDGPYKWSIQLCSLIWLQRNTKTYMLNMFSEPSLHCLFSNTTLFPLKNFNLPLNSNDRTTSHLKHPHQTPKPTAPLKDARAEERQHLLTDKALFYSPLNLSRSRWNMEGRNHHSHFTDETQKHQPDWSYWANQRQYHGQHPAICL